MQKFDCSICSAVHVNSSFLGKEVLTFAPNMKLSNMRFVGVTLVTKVNKDSCHSCSCVNVKNHSALNEAAQLKILSGSASRWRSAYLGGDYTDKYRCLFQIT